MTDLLLANSELETAQRCWRKWYFAYYRLLGLRREDMSGPRAIGNRVHYALAEFYEKGVDPVELVAYTVRADAEEFPEQAEDLLKDGELAHAMVEGYLQWLEETGADEDLEFISAEEEVREKFAKIGEYKVWMVGRLDQRVRRRTDGATAFIDHKTVGNFTDLVKVARIAQQFLHYDLLEYLRFLREERPIEERTDGGIYNMLRKVKRTARATPPFYMRHEVRHNLDELRSYWTRVHAIAEDIVWRRARLDEGQDPRTIVYPTPTRDCSWSCDFFAICPMVDDGSDVEGVIEYAYTVKQPRYALEGGE